MAMENRYGRRPAFTAPILHSLPRSARQHAADLKYEEYRIAFDRYDIDGTGRLDEWEVRQVFKDVKGKNEDDKMKLLLTAIAQSPNESGLTYIEFVTIMARDRVLALAGDERATLEAYASLGGNSDKSGHVSADRVRRACADHDLTIDIDEIIAQFDTDRSGQIEYGEFAMLFEEEFEAGDRNPLSINARIVDLDSTDEEDDESEEDEDEVRENERTPSSGDDDSNNEVVMRVQITGINNIDKPATKNDMTQQQYQPHPPIHQPTATTPRRRA